MYPRPSASRLWRTQDSAAVPDASSPVTLLGILSVRQSPQRHFPLEGTPTILAIRSQIVSGPPPIGSPTLRTCSAREGSPPPEDFVELVRFPTTARIPAASDPTAAEDADATIPDLQLARVANIPDLHLRLLPAPARIE